MTRGEEFERLAFQANREKNDSLVEMEFVLIQKLKSRNQTVTPAKDKTGTGKTSNDLQISSLATLSQISKSLKELLGEGMTKVEAYERAWDLAMKGDFSLVDQIYHPDYKSFDLRTGIYANLEDDKVIVSTLAEDAVTSSMEVIFEHDNFMCFIAYQKVLDPEPRFRAFMTAINYQDGLILNQKTTVEELDYDPSEHLDWNWEDYK